MVLEDVLAGEAAGKAGVEELPPVMEVTEGASEEFRRSSRRVRPGDELSMVLPGGAESSLEVSVIRHGRHGGVLDASLYDISDDGLGIATAEKLEAGEIITLCVTSPEETEPLFAEELVIAHCSRVYSGKRPCFVSGVQYPGSATCPLYKATLDTLYLATRNRLAA